MEEQIDPVQRLNLSAIERYYKLRLGSIFARVAENTYQLTNSKNVPLYVLFFAAGNEKGAPIAVKIAESIMKRR